MSFLILRDIPKTSVFVNGQEVHIKGGFRGFKNVPLGTHKVAIPPQEITITFSHSGQCLIYVYHQDQIIPETNPETIQMFSSLALSGSMNQVLLDFPTSPMEDSSLEGIALLRSIFPNMDTSFVELAWSINKRNFDATVEFILAANNPSSGPAPYREANSEMASARTTQEMEDLLGDMVEYSVLTRNVEKVSQAMSTLLIYVRNLIDHPEEDKYKRINPENAKFKERIATIPAALEFLHGLGFVRDPSSSHLLLSRVPSKEYLEHLIQEILAAKSSLSMVSLTRANTPSVHTTHKQFSYIDQFRMNKIDVTPELRSSINTAPGLEDLHDVHWSEYFESISSPQSVDRDSILGPEFESLLQVLRETSKLVETYKSQQEQNIHTDNEVFDAGAQSIAFKSVENIENCVTKQDRDNVFAMESNDSQTLQVAQPLPHDRHNISNPISSNSIDLLQTYDSFDPDIDSVLQFKQGITSMYDAFDIEDRSDLTEKSRTPSVTQQDAVCPITHNAHPPQESSDKVHESNPKAKVGDVLEIQSEFDGVDWSALFVQHSTYNTEKNYEQADIFASINSFAKVCQDFGFAVLEGARKVVHQEWINKENGNIRQEKIGGIAGGKKYYVNGIIFKFALDNHNLYGGDEFAMKACSHELKSASAIRLTGLLDIAPPLIAQVDYLGFRLFGVCRFPLKTDETLHYGSADAGKTFVDRFPHSANRRMRYIGQYLNISPHWFGNESGRLNIAYGPVDAEIHLLPENYNAWMGVVNSIDTEFVDREDKIIGKYYNELVLKEYEQFEDFDHDKSQQEYLDFKQSTQRIPQQSQEGIEKTADDEVIALSEEFENRIKMPKQIEQRRAFTRSKYVAIDLARIFPPEPPSVGKEQGLKRPHLFRLLRPELVRISPFPLSSDAFTGFGRVDMDVHNHRVRYIFNYLMEHIIPDFSSMLDQGKIAFSPTNIFVQSLHRHGINVRWIGKVRSITKTTGPRQALLYEMVFRVLKNRSRALLRQEIQNLPSDQDVLQVMVAVLTQLCDAHGVFWTTELVPTMVWNYPEGLSDDEAIRFLENPQELLNQLDRKQLFHRLCQQLGIRLSNQLSLSESSWPLSPVWPENRPLKLNASHISSIAPVPKYPAYIYLNQSVSFVLLANACQDFEEKCSWIMKAFKCAISGLDTYPQDTDITIDISSLLVELMQLLITVGKIQLALQIAEMAESYSLLVVREIIFDLKKLAHFVASLYSKKRELEMIIYSQEKIPVNICIDRIFHKPLNSTPNIHSSFQERIEAFWRAEAPSNRQHPIDNVDLNSMLERINLDIVLFEVMLEKRISKLSEITFNVGMVYSYWSTILQGEQRAALQTRRIRTFERTIELCPDFVRPLNEIGRAYTELKQFEEAIAFFQLQEESLRSKSAMKNLGAAMFNVAHALYDYGKHLKDNGVPLEEVLVMLQRAETKYNDALDISVVFKQEVDPLSMSAHVPMELAEWYNAGNLQIEIAHVRSELSGKMGDSQAALHLCRGIEFFSRALAIHPKYDKAQANLISARFQLAIHCSSLTASERLVLASNLTPKQSMYVGDPQLDPLKLIRLAKSEILSMQITQGMLAKNQSMQVDFVRTPELVSIRAQTHLKNLQSLLEGCEAIERLIIDSQ